MPLETRRLRLHLADFEKPTGPHRLDPKPCPNDTRTCNKLRGEVARCWGRRVWPRHPKNVSRNEGWDFTCEEHSLGGRLPVAGTGVVADSAGRNRYRDGLAHSAGTTRRAREQLRLQPPDCRTDGGLGAAGRILLRTMPWGRGSESRQLDSGWKAGPARGHRVTGWVTRKLEGHEHSRLYPASDYLRGRN
jgi:hypothetical protein